MTDGDVATEVAAPVGNIVETSACNSCHGPRIGNVGHGGGYNLVEVPGDYTDFLIGSDVTGADPRLWSSFSTTVR